MDVGNEQLLYYLTLKSVLKIYITKSQLLNAEWCGHD